MKRMKILIIILALNLRAYCPEFHALYVPEDQKVQTQVIYRKLIYAVNMAEAQINDVNFDTLAYNKVSKATGAFQITPIRLADFNRRTSNHYNYKLKDCFRYEVGLRIFLYYAIGDEKDIACSWYGYDKNTYKYWLKIKRRL